MDSVNCGGSLQPWRIWIGFITTSHKGIPRRSGRSSNAFVRRRRIWLAFRSPDAEGMLPVLASFRLAGCLISSSTVSTGIPSRSAGRAYVDELSSGQVAVVRQRRAGGEDSITDGQRLRSIPLKEGVGAPPEPERTGEGFTPSVIVQYVANQAQHPQQIYGSA